MNWYALPLLLALASPPSPQVTPPAPTGAPKVEALAWLAGCWALIDAEPGSGEVWMAPAAGTLVGVSRSVKDGRTVGWELMRIRETESGGLEFVAQPSGLEGGAFPLVRLGPREAVFENLRHDFPQRILYRLDDDGVLRARIEGHEKGEERGIDFPMRRTPCEVSPPGAGR
jgi:hypothetical protein